MYVYVFREYCLQLVMYSGSAQGVVERVINVRYYHYHQLLYAAGVSQAFSRRVVVVVVGTGNVACVCFQVNMLICFCKRPGLS